MNKQKMRAIATSYNLYDDMVTIWMLPVVTLRHNIAFTNAQELFGITMDEWKEKASDAQTMFYLAEGNMVDIEINDMPEDHPFSYEINGLKTYWDNRNSDFGNNWEWFISCVTGDVVYGLYRVYQETRRKIPKIESEILKKPPPDIQTDPKGTGSGRKRTKKKSVSS